MPLINEYCQISWNLRAGGAIVMWNVVWVLLGTVLFTDTPLKVSMLCLQVIFIFTRMSTFKKISSCLENSFWIKILMGLKCPLYTLWIFFLPAILAFFYIFFFLLSSLAYSFVWVPLATSFTNGKIAVLSVISLWLNHKQNLLDKAFRFSVPLLLLWSWTFNIVYQGDLQILNLSFS